MDKREIITSIKKYISFLKENKLPVQRVYVFGSYAKGNMHDDSDIDLAIVLEYLENMEKDELTDHGNKRKEKWIKTLQDHRDFTIYPNP